MDILDKEQRLSCLLYQIAIDKAKAKLSLALNLKGTLEYTPEYKFHFPSKDLTLKDSGLGL